MKKLNMSMSILFIMFIANCMGMETITSQDVNSKIIESSDNNNMIIGNNFGENNTNIDSLNAIYLKEKIYNNDIPKLTNLFDYIYNGDLESFKNLLEKKPILKLMTDYNGNDALMLAAYYGREEFIKILLNNDTLYYRMNYRINLCATNGKGENALLMATRENHINIVRLLVEQDSNMMRVDGGWSPAFIAACENKNWDIAVYLLDNFKFKAGVTSREIKYSFKRLFTIVEELDASPERDKLEQMLQFKRELIEKSIN